MDEQHAPAGSSSSHSGNLPGSDEVLARLRKLPGGNELLAVAAQRPDEVELVGGAVRDILLGRTPRELDVVVESDATGFAQTLAAQLQTLVGQDASARLETHLHDRFKTALVRWAGGEVDIATRRSESYASPGALPEIAQGTPEQDLTRRDFTVNAIAFALTGPLAGHLRSVPHALDDLAHGELRVLHERSFIEDPTRLLRLARYAARLDFKAEPHTAELAEQAVNASAISTVSGARVGAELRLALTETDPLASMRELARLGVLGALHPLKRLDEGLVQSALSLLNGCSVRVDLLVFASLLLPQDAGTDSRTVEEARVMLDRLEFPAGDRDRVIACIAAATRLAARLAATSVPSRLYSLLAGVPLEGVALAGATGGSRAAVNARRWIQELSHVRLQITGDDLIAAGVPVGPEIGRRLSATLDHRLDGRLAPGREAELRCALEGK
ncbi:MAG TPA: hypothetical protein VIC05_11010 [Solirubrobacteraceae bacterium]